jgi:predicted HTH transcriptional regulator
MLFNIPLNLINEGHLQNLVNAVPEGRQIEYKQQLPGNSYEDVVEFLKDVSAMANSIGGDILYGVREGRDESGNTLAVAVDGVAGVDADAAILRLENFIRNSIKLRLIGLQIRPISLTKGNQVFIIRVPRSWNAPHVVEYQRHWRFYYRNSAGTHPMDVTELRHAITFQDTLRRRLEEFRIERLAKIAGDETLLPTGKIVLHFQPLDSLDENFEVDIRVARAQPNFHSSA